MPDRDFKPSPSRKKIRVNPFSAMSRRPGSPFALLCQCAVGFVLCALWFQPPMQLCMVVGVFVLIVPVLGLALTKKR